MKPSLDDLFVRLEPPPGGEQLLRERLSSWRPHRHRLRWAVLTAAPAIAMLVLWLVLPHAGKPPVVVEPYPLSHPALVGLGLADDPGPVSVPEAMRGRVAVRAVSVEDNVVFYMVASSLPGLDQRAPESPPALSNPPASHAEIE